LSLSNIHVTVLLPPLEKCPLSPQDIFLRAAAIHLHVYCSKTIAYDLQMTINVSSCLSSRYRKKRRS